MSDQAMSAITEISATELFALGTDAHVIDVREPDEWEAGHIPHAVHIPLSSVPDSIDAFSGTPTYVVCKVGGRSMRACEFAAGHGKHVVNIAGGMLAWERAGLAVDGTTKIAPA